MHIGASAGREPVGDILGGLCFERVAGVQVNLESLDGLIRLCIRSLASGCRDKSQCAQHTGADDEVTRTRPKGHDGECVSMMIVVD